MTWFGGSGTTKEITTLLTFQAEVVEKEYDAKRAREERENLMNHYEKLLKEKIDQLSIEKRETSAIREAMAKVMDHIWAHFWTR